MHYYGNRNQMARVEETYNGAWHVANYYGNMNFVGYEVCESLKVSDADFIANEEAVFEQAAKDLMEWGLPANRNTVKIHRRFVPTSCPHRSWDLHVGKGAPDTDANQGKMEDYFIARIKAYMDGSAKPVEPETPTAVKPDVEKLIGGIGMFIYWEPQAKGSVSDAYGVWGNKRFYITPAKLQHFKNLVKDATGKACKEYRFKRGSDEIKTIESFTELQKTV
nr:MAG TPA: Endolysin [Caudoviricetes sp.]